MDGAITFDFHDTLARCDAWFELEVRHLVSAFLRWRVAEQGEPVDDGLLAAADADYRELRQAIVLDGRERTAEACVGEVLGGLGVAVEAATIARGVEELMRGTLEEARPVDGAAETVRALRAADVRLGIVSSAVYHPFLEWTLAKFGLRDAFADVTTSASAGYYKSRPELYRHALAALSAAPERSVHVGDSYRYDVGGARRAGMRTVWLRPDVDRAPEGEPPDLTLTTLAGSAPRILGVLRGSPA